MVRTLVDYFPEFNGPPKDPKKAQDFIQEMFINYVNSDELPEHVTEQELFSFKDSDQQFLESCKKSFKKSTKRKGEVYSHVTSFTNSNEMPALYEEFRLDIKDIIFWDNVRSVTMT